MLLRKPRASAAARIIDAFGPKNAVLGPEDTGILSPQNALILSPKDAVVLSPQNAVVLCPEDAVVSTPDDVFTWSRSDFLDGQPLAICGQDAPGAERIPPRNLGLAGDRDGDARRQLQGCRDVQAARPHL